MSIYEHFLTHGDLIRLLPGLKAQTLRNWSRDGFVDVEDPNPGVGADRKYSALGAIKLAAMHELVRMGVAVSAARKMTNDLGPTIVMAFHMGRASSHLPRAVICWREEDGSYALSTHDWRSLSDRGDTPHVYITLQIGLLTIQMRERMERLRTEEDAA